jgi:CBS domain-containing protein
MRVSERGPHSIDDDRTRPGPCCLELGKENAMKVGDVMTPHPWTCRPYDRLDAAAHIMWNHDCGAVPVVDSDGVAVAMITDRDVCMAAYTQGRPLREIEVASAASRGLVSVGEHDPLDVAESLMRREKIRRLPVLDGEGRPVGILSLSDLARRIHAGHRLGELGMEAVARTLAAVCAPNGPAAAAE